MVRTFAACLVCLVAFVLGTADARDRMATGREPALFKVVSIDNDTIELKGYKSIKHRSSLKELEIYDAGGKTLTVDELRERVKAGSVVLVAPDENKVDAAYLNIFKEDTIVLSGVTVTLARADRPGRGWTLDLKEMKATQDPVAGRMLGQEFKPDQIQLLNTGLSVRSGRDMIHIFLNLKPGQGIEGRTFEYDADGLQGRTQPAIHFHVSSTNPPRSGAYVKGYAMRLEFGKEKEGSIPAKIYLCLPDDAKSWIAGSFSVHIE